MRLNRCRPRGAGHVYASMLRCVGGYLSNEMSWRTCSPESASGPNETMHRTCAATATDLTYMLCG